MFRSGIHPLQPGVSGSHAVPVGPGTLLECGRYRSRSTYDLPVVTETLVSTLDRRLLATRCVGPDDGWPVVLFTGVPNSRLVAPDEATAHSAKVRVLTFDRPGYGGSTPLGRNQDPRNLADLHSILSHFGIDEFSALGWSAGARHAVAAAAGFEQRCHTVGLVSPLGPVTSATYRTTLPRIRALQIAALTRVPRHLRRPAAKRVLGPTAKRAKADPHGRLADLRSRANAADRALQDDPAIAEVLLADVIQTFAREGAGWFNDVAQMTCPWPARPSAITQSVTIWHGRDDPEVSPNGAEALAEDFPCAELRLIDRAGHLLLFDAWLEVLTALELNRTPRPVDLER